MAKMNPQLKALLEKYHEKLNDNQVLIDTEELRWIMVAVLRALIDDDNQT